MPLIAPEYIHDRLVEAALTLRALPMDRRGRPSGMRIYWPDIIRESAEAYGWYGDPGWTAPDGSVTIPRGQPPRPRPSAPSPARIQRMDEAINWMWYARPEAWPLLWFKAMFPRRDFGLLADRFGCSARTIRRRWRAALIDIALALSPDVEKKILDPVRPVQVFRQLSDRLAYCAPHPVPESGRGIFAAGSPVSSSRNRFG